MNINTLVVLFISDLFFVVVLKPRKVIGSEIVFFGQ